MEIIQNAVNLTTGFWLPAFSEFIGTALLILLGNGVCAAVSFKKMGANQSGKFVLIVFGWAFAVFLGALVSSSMGGYGHLNPAVTIMDAIKNSVNVGELTIYSTAMQGFNITASAAIALVFFLFLVFQMTGAMFGQMVLNFINCKFLKDKENDILTIRGTHCTAPAWSNREDKATIFNFSYELVGTLVLCGVILALGNKKFDANLGGMNGVPVTFLIASIGISLGSATGYAINPVRDLGPRIIYVSFVKLFRKEDIVEKHANWGYSWVPVVAPLVGGIIIGCLGLISV